jgi:signal transduction histidine kinase
MKKSILSHSQRVNERNIAFGRLAIVLIMASIFVFRLVSGIDHLNPGSPAFLMDTGSIIIALAFSLFILLLCGYQEVPAWTPPLSVVVDLLIITVALFSPPLGQNVPSWEYIPGSSFYGIYFITIFFTIFRLQKGLSLLAGILAGGIYLTLTILFIDQWVNTSWINELEKAGFLILTGVLAQTASRGLVKNNYAFLATEQKLLETDERLRQLSANLPGGVFQFLWQASGKVDVLYLSSGIQDLLGVSNKEIFRKPNSLLKIFTQDHHKRFFFQASRSRHQAQDWSMELQVSAKKDLWVRAIFSGRPIKSSTEGGAMIHGLLLDISAKKGAELKMKKAWAEAEEANRVKTHFLANMSHELRTPLNAIIGFSDLLFQSGLTLEQRANLQSIRSSGESLLSLIEDVLDFSRLEVGQLKISPRFFVLNDLILEVYHSLSPIAEEKGLQFTVKLLHDSPWQLKADPMRIKQILLNLVGNALKFTEEGSVVLSYAIIKEPRESILFQIKDSGIGIPEENLEDIFQEFSQIDHTHTRRYGGTGLGLAISRSLAQLMDGDITVKSEVGQGSTFSLSLPLLGQARNFPIGVTR